MRNAVRKIMILREDIAYQPTKHNGETVYVCSDKRQYLDITGDDNYGRIALSILKKRFDSNSKKFYLAKPTKPLPCSVSQTQWESTTEDHPDYDHIKSIVDSSIADRKKYENDLKSYNAILDCIATNDIQLAPALLEERRNCPNEGFDITYLYDDYEG